MTWLAALFIALVTGVVGAFTSGYIANLAVDWYHIPGREGASGYFVVLLGLLGFVVGFLIGLVVCRSMVAGGAPAFFKGLGVSLAVLLAIVGGVGGVARLLADVPPEIDGEPLLLAVEVRWPEGQTTSPAGEPGEGVLYLRSVPRFSHTVRASVRGPLWKEDARQVDGRWVVPGAVEIFTSRGHRMLEVVLTEKNRQGFLLALRGRPGRKDLQWSDWLPRWPAGQTPPAGGLTYRYRAQRQSEPIRIETIGPFEIATIASQFYDAQVWGGGTTIAAVAEFTIRYRGQPVTLDGNASTSTDPAERADAVAALPGPKPGLLVHLSAVRTGDGSAYLLAGDGDRLRVEKLGTRGGSAIQPDDLTSDTARLRLVRHREAPRGRIDRLTFDRGGLYLFGQVVLDTRTLTVRRFTGDSTLTGIPSVPPLGLSPDERSFVRYDYADHSTEKPVLAVTDFVADRSYSLPIDETRMRYATLDALDPAWVAHHFRWERGGDGVDRLVERTNFIPLPYRGALSVEADGYRSYKLEPAGAPLRTALEEFLVAEFKAERVPSDSGAYEDRLRIDDREVLVACSNDSHYVSVYLQRGTADTTLVQAIAQRFDAALATGKYDALFRK